MTTILCPTRGGEASRPNQDRAIAIAKERGARLLFLYVSDVRFLLRFASAKVVDVEAELEEMGEFLLTMAQERAEKAGVRSRAIVRSGVFREALGKVIQEHEVASVVLGTAAGGTGITSPDYLKELVDWILREHGIEVIVLYQGEIVEHHQS